MMKLTIKKKLILYSCLLVAGTVLMSILASVYLNHQQITEQNQARINSAMMRFDRIINQNLIELDNGFRAFSEKESFTMILLNCIQQNYFYFPSIPEIFDLGPGLRLDRFAIYFPTKFTGPDILQIYFDKTIGGVVKAKGNTHTLIRQKGGEIEEKEINVSGIYPDTYQPGMSYSIQSNGADIRIIAHFEYINNVDASAFGSQFEKGKRIGYFILEKPLEVNLVILDYETGVNVNLYDHEGKLIGGQVHMPDLETQKSSFSERIVTLTDKNNQDYYSVIKPVMYQESPIAYVSFSISQAQTKAEIRKTVKTLCLIGLGAIVIGVFFSFFINQGIVRSINRVVRGLTEISDQVALTAGGIRAASQSLATDSALQAESLERTASFLKNMTLMSQETLKVTEGVEDLMNENIRKSGQSLKSLVQVTTEMSGIEAESGQIGQIIKTIDNVAFQTNLLALNAAVEAARAGDAGAGFAVVAEEVRNLAVSTTETAKGAQRLLSNIVQRVTHATNSIREVNKDFEGIIESATIMGERTASITTANKEQAGEIGQINKAISGTEYNIRQNAESAGESASASREMNTQAEQMKRMVAELVALVGGTSDQRVKNKARQPSLWTRFFTRIRSTKL